jgi:hypothetical protein
MFSCHWGSQSSSNWPQGIYISLFVQLKSLTEAHWNELSLLCEFLRVDLSPQIATRRKLSASMQDQLTSMLRPHLDAFGYS